MDKNITELNSKKVLDYELMNRIREHANLYNEAYDKKEFLKNVSIHEQKIILLNSSNPYEVLNYLDELDLDATKLLIEQLNYNEIKDIISLFSSEDKKKFYATFSNLDLVNQFIIQDKKSSDYVENLSFERKVELINSLDKETKEATTVIYDSMQETEKVSVVEKVTDIDAINVLGDTVDYNENQQEETQQLELDEGEKNIKTELEEKNTKPELEEKKEEEEKIQKEKPEEKEQEFKDEEKNKINDNPQFEEYVINEKEQDSDYPFVPNDQHKNKENDVEQDLENLVEFHKSVIKCEQQELIHIINKQQILDNDPIKTK